mmetsp:Transcript_46222/g.108479  ORF Transcript_46222/g.108479 Transcript_46222/m.108479 type:complete len:97 (+) Transcript_46222:208-498(+)
MTLESDAPDSPACIIIIIIGVVVVVVDVECWTGCERIIITAIIIITTTITIIIITIIMFGCCRDRVGMPLTESESESVWHPSRGTTVGSGGYHDHP